MKKNLLYILGLFLMMGCGAQNNPIEENSEPGGASSSTAPTAIPETFVTEGSRIILPESIAIDFPVALKASSNISFNKSVNRVQTIIDSEKYNLGLLALAIDEIGGECPDANDTCYFEKDFFRVNYNHQTVLLGGIRLNKYQIDSKNGYNLTLNLNDNVKIQYEWLENEKSVFTTYIDGNTSVGLQYFKDNNNSEASYIDDTLPNEKNSFMVKVEDNGTSLYVLNSNHIKDNKQDFSSSLRLENQVLLAKDESFFNFKDDNITNSTVEINSTVYTDSDDNISLTLGTLDSLSINRIDTRVVMLDYLSTKELEDGDYLVFEPNTKVETLNLFEQLKLAIARFTYFKEEVLGLVVTDMTSESFEGFKVIPLKIKK